MNRVDKQVEETVALVFGKSSNDPAEVGENGPVAFNQKSLKLTKEKNPIAEAIKAAVKK